MFFIVSLLFLSPSEPSIHDFKNIIVSQIRLIKFAI